jgi:hypothetical protein
MSSYINKLSEVSGLGYDPNMPSPLKNKDVFKDEGEEIARE